MKRLLGLLALIFGAALLVWSVAHAWLDTPHRFQFGRFCGSLFMGAIFASIGYRWLLNIIDLDALSVDPNDARIRAVTSDAQTTLTVFHEYLLQNRFECTAKIPVTTASGGTEHVWVNVHTVAGAQYIVSLASEPSEPLLVTDARFAVAASQLEDWHVQLSPTSARGGYSIRAMRTIAEQRGLRLSRQAKRQLATFEEHASV